MRVLNFLCTCFTFFSRLLFLPPHMYTHILGDSSAPIHPHTPSLAHTCTATSDVAFRTPSLRCACGDEMRPAVHEGEWSTRTHAHTRLPRQHSSLVLCAFSPRRTLNCTLHYCTLPHSSPKSQEIHHGSEIADRRPSRLAAFTACSSVSKQVSCQLNQDAAARSSFVSLLASSADSDPVRGHDANNSQF